MKTLLYLLLSLLFTSVFSEKDYEGSQVLTAIPENQEQLKLLQELSLQDDVDFFKTSTSLGALSEFLVPAKRLNEIKDALAALQLTYIVTSENVAEDLQKSFERLQNQPKAFDLNQYNTLEDIFTGLDNFITRCPSSASCVIEDIGLSPENRPIKLFKIVKPSQRQIVWIDSTIHAREWLAPATNLKLLDAILAQENSDAVDLLNKYDFYFVIVMNPDGYKYTWESPFTRLWRKNRTPNEGSSCIGTDLNRNYDVNWMSDGTSSNPCSDIYGGSSAASERETQVVQNYMNTLRGRIFTMISLHTAAQMILISYGHTNNGICVRPDDYNDILAAANSFADAIENTHGTTWQRGTGCEIIYPTSGSSMDYAYDKVNMKYSFTPELRGPGFDPPANQIEPSFQEIWNGLVATAKKIEEIEENKN